MTSVIIILVLIVWGLASGGFREKGYKPPYLGGKDDD